MHAGSNTIVNSLTPAEKVASLCCACVCSTKAELAMYSKEQSEQEGKIEKLRASNADEYDIRQQVPTHAFAPRHCEQMDLGTYLATGKRACGNYHDDSGY